MCPGLHESAIGIVNGKARLLREDYCDGLGDCLPACPTNAISFVEREAAAYDEEAVLENKKKLEAQASTPVSPVHTGCPGSMAKRLRRTGDLPTSQNMGKFTEFCHPTEFNKFSEQACKPRKFTCFYNNNNQNNASPVSQLQQWPVQ